MRVLLCNRVAVYLSGFEPSSFVRIHSSANNPSSLVLRNAVYQCVYSWWFAGTRSICSRCTQSCHFDVSMPLKRQSTWLTRVRIIENITAFANALTSHYLTERVLVKGFMKKEFLENILMFQGRYKLKHKRHHIIAHSRFLGSYLTSISHN